MKRILKQYYPDKVIAVSIMGQNSEQWTKMAKLAEEAGADLIECNFSCPQMTIEGTGSAIGQSPELIRKFTSAVRKGTILPVIAKMTPNISKMEIPAETAVKNGANAISAINTIKAITAIIIPIIGVIIAVIPKTAVEFATMLPIISPSACSLCFNRIALEP